MVFYNCTVCGTKAKNPECYKHSEAGKKNKEEAAKRYMETEKGVASRTEANRRSYEKKRTMVKKNELGVTLSYDKTSAFILCRQIESLFMRKFERIGAKDGLRFYSEDRLIIIDMFVKLLIDTYLVNQSAASLLPNLSNNLNEFLRWTNYLDAYVKLPAEEQSEDTFKKNLELQEYRKTSISNDCDSVCGAIVADLKMKINDVDCGFYVMLIKECFDAAHCKVGYTHQITSSPSVAYND